MGRTIGVTRVPFVALVYIEQHCAVLGEALGLSRIHHWYGLVFVCHLATSLGYPTP